MRLGGLTNMGYWKGGMDDGYRKPRRRSSSGSGSFILFYTFFLLYQIFLKLFVFYLFACEKFVLVMY